MIQSLIWKRLYNSLNNLYCIQRDAGEYFMINSTKGYLYQIKHFDYEDTDIQCGLGKRGGFLNITAEVTLYVTEIFDLRKSLHYFIYSDYESSMIMKENYKTILSIHDVGPTDIGFSFYMRLIFFLIK